MRPPAKPRVQPKPVAAKSAMPAPAAPSRAPESAPTRSAADTLTEAIPRAELPSPARRKLPRPPRPAKTEAASAKGQRGRPTVSTAMAQRLAERRAMQRHRILKRLGLWSAVLAALAGVVHVVFFSSVLALDTGRVTITGQGTTVDVAQVQQIVNQEAGVPLPRIDTVGLRSRLLELDPVKDVRIMRAWPHGLEVTLTSREPVAAVPVEEGLALVDPEGVRVGTVPEPPEGLPVIQVALDDEHNPALLAALHVVAGLPPDLLGEVREVSAASRDDVRTTLHSGQEIKWGSDAQVTLKVAVVQTLRQAAPDAHLFDVSSPNLPVTR